MHTDNEVFYTLNRLSRSKFRSRFKLKTIDVVYLKEKGLERIESHARDFVLNRLAAQDIQNDGKQTPFKGHPVFIAQHATATCCRTCLEKWHNFPKDRALKASEIIFIIKLIMNWIDSSLKE